VGQLITERITTNARESKLLGLAETADELVDSAENAKLGYREFLDLVLESEIGVLKGRRYASHLKLSGLPHHKTLEEFEISFQPELDPKRLAELRSLRFIERHVCALILGPPGVGKTHIAVAIAMDAIKAGYLIRYTTLDDLVRDLRQADRIGKPPRQAIPLPAPPTDLRRGRLPTPGARRRQPLLPAHQPPLHPLIHNHHQQQARHRVGRPLRRWTTG
jgi:DNA replication protein DnaC